MGTEKNASSIKSGLLLFIVALLIFSPLIFNPGGKFSGTDDGARNAIGEINNQYKPWFKPPWKPPGKEIESLLFTLQASVGTAIIAFYLGYLTGKNRRS